MNVAAEVRGKGVRHRVRTRGLQMPSEYTDSYLDRYEALRRPAAKQVLRLAGRLTQMATIKSIPGRIFRNLALWLIDYLPIARRRLEMNLSGLSRRAAADLEVAGPQRPRAAGVSDSKAGIGRAV